LCYICGKAAHFGDEMEYYFLMHGVFTKIATMDSDFLSEKLAQIDKFFKYGIFEVVEDAKLEVKDLSTGSDWYSLRETICAFLNTSGGYIICGIREKVKEKQYKLNGFDRNNENNLIELRTKFFEADNGIFPELYDNINFNYILFNNTDLAIIYVTSVSEDLKFLKFDKKYFERVLAQDKIISPSKILQQQEYKQEIEYSKELSILPSATFAALDIDKINQFILRINATIKKETVKKDIEDARSFLSRRHCIKEMEVTTLGMLLFGTDPYQYLQERAEVNCYYGTNEDIGQDKHYFQNDVLNLMDDTFRFIWGHIKVGRSYIGGGKSEPEYPEKLIRESINNALAHRDYTVNRFVTIKVRPNEQIEITNRFFCLIFLLLLLQN
jgi:ATP-dependent DNA helicase RecG